MLLSIRVQHVAETEPETEHVAMYATPPPFKSQPLNYILSLHDATESQTGTRHTTSFRTPFDAAFARWLHDEDISSNAINRLLQNPDTQTVLAGHLSWRSAQELKSKMQGDISKLSAIAGDYKTK